MKKCVVKMLNGEAVGILYKSKDKYDVLRDKELIKYLARIDERLYGRKVREIPGIQNEGLHLIFINKHQGKNIRIENYRRTSEVLFELYTKNKKNIDDELKTEKIVKNVLIGVIGSTVISCGSLALAHMGETSGIDFDIKNTAIEDLESIQKENSEKLAYLSNIVLDKEDEVEDVKTYETEYTIEGTLTPVVDKNYEINNDIEMETITEDEIQSIIDTPVVNIDVEAVYDPGIEKNLESLEDYIHERGARWGISDSLIRDIISQESSGGSIDNVGQLEWDVWADHPFQVHNFEENKDVKVVFSNNPSRWQNKMDIIITQQDLKNKKTQVSEVCILMRYFLDRYDNNIGLAIQAYNRGERNVNELLVKTSKGEGKSVYEIIKNDKDFSWINYAWKDDNGLTYLQEVVKHISENDENGLNEPYTILYKDGNGNTQTKSIQFQVQESTKTL